MSDVDQNSLKVLGWSAASSEIRESTCTTKGLSTKGQARKPKSQGAGADCVGFTWRAFPASELHCA